MPWVASPLSSNDHRYFTWNYIFIRHILWVLLGASFMIWVFACFDFYFKSWILAGHTFLREPKLCYDLLKLLSMLHLNFYELWNCSSASLISFWARCALVFLKKCSHASIIFIWELVNFLRNSLMLHSNYFERRKFLCSCSSLRFVWAIKSKISN
jgi:hypothetical protein